MQEAWILLNAILPIYKAKLKMLVEFYGDPQKVLLSSDEELLRTGIVNHGFVKALRYAQKNFDLKQEYLLIERYQPKVITFWDEGYPASLKYLSDGPIILYCLGEIKKSDIFSLGIVGTRHNTAYGKNVALRLSADLAESGVTIVSGLARGIDTYAHQAAIEKKGRTIAVLGGGLAHLYPPENESLALQIRNQGAVISESSMSARPDKTSFPLRNRIISGLSLGVVVIEADEQSGALITARWALDQGREVFAVPGNITSPYSRGSNGLIKDGAKLVENASDVIEEIECLKRIIKEKKKKVQNPSVQSPLTAAEEKILHILSSGPVNIEALCTELQMHVYKLSPVLLQLEMKELIRETSGKNYIRI